MTCPRPMQWDASKGVATGARKYEGHAGSTPLIKLLNILQHDFIGALLSLRRTEGCRFSGFLERVKTLLCGFMGILICRVSVPVRGFCLPLHNHQHTVNRGISLFTFKKPILLQCTLQIDGVLTHLQCCAKTEVGRVCRFSCSTKVFNCSVVFSFEFNEVRHVGGCQHNFVLWELFSERMRRLPLV
ncbi:hypothetical protein CLU91_4562 [Janthinobacterium sp. 64]|nr:hypothetical protein CLU91_4562 [Janthinobacterium sp. 64]